MQALLWLKLSDCLSDSFVFLSSRESIKATVSKIHSSPSSPNPLSRCYSRMYLAGDMYAVETFKRRHGKRICKFM